MLAVWSLLAVHGASPSPSPLPTASPTPVPTPTPKNAFLSLDSAAGPSTTAITVNGSQFLPNEKMTLYWDPPSNKVAAGATADANGNFSVQVKPFAGDALGLHHLCANVPPLPCAEFTLTAAPPPSPAASPTPSPTPSPSPSPTPSPSPSPTPAPTLPGLDIMSKPPYVFVPIAGVVAILLALGYWLLTIFLRRPRSVSLPSAAIVHRASRPDYAAGFGTPPAPPTPEPPPSAWADVVPPVPPPPAVPQPPSAGSPEPPPAGPTLPPAGPGEPPA
jgi:hypothetical protein